MEFQRVGAKLSLSAQWLLVATFLFFPVAMGLGNVALLLACVLALVSGVWWRQRGMWKAAAYPWVALALYAVVLLGAVWSPAAWDEIALKYAKYVKVALSAVCFVLLAQSQWRTRCLQAFALAMLFIMVSAFANVFVQLPWSKTQNLGWGQDHTVIGDYITQNIMMSFFAVLALWHGLQKRCPVQRYGCWLVAVLAAVVVTQLSLGRTGYVLLLLGVGSFVFFALKGWRRWAALAAIVITVGGGVAASTTAQQRIALAVAEARSSEQMEITSIGGRVNFWTHTWELIAQKPVVGWGTGSYHQTWCEYVTKAGWCEFGRWHPHNQYLYLWMENGLLGVALFVALMGLLVVTVWRDDRWRPLVLSFVTILAVNSLINASLFSSREREFFTLMMALFAAQAYFGRTDRVQHSATQ